jgi:hypothetical protein
MLTIDLSYAERHHRPGLVIPVFGVPESAHECMTYAARLQKKSALDLMDLETTTYAAWIWSMDRRFDRPREETEALERVRVLIENERARRDPKYGAYLEEKRAFAQRKRA